MPPTPDVGESQGNLRGAATPAIYSQSLGSASPMTPWAQRPDETARAYALFALYRDAGPLERSIRKVAGQTGRSVDGMEQLSRRHSWVGRAAAWDAETERLKRSTHVREIAALARREVLAGRLLQGRGLERIQSLADKDVAALTIGEAIRLVVVGAELERTGLGWTADMAMATSTPAPMDDGSAPIVEILRRHPSASDPWSPA